MSAAAEVTGAGRCPMRAAASWLSLALRVGLGGLLAFSGWMKLGLHTDLGLQEVMPLKSLQPMDFYFAISGFKMGLPEHTMIVLSFVIPWAELLTGLAVLAGLWTRASAVLAAGMMVAFTAGIVSVMARGLDVNCPCFGAIKLFCPAQIGGCHVVRNSGFFAASVLILALGPGRVSLDRLFERLRGG